jgi:Domain of unknown function (DUF1990)
MSAETPRGRRFSVAARWPVGIAITSWRYMWRTTPLRRQESQGFLPDDAPPAIPESLARADTQHLENGAGHMYHRRYRVLVSEPRMTAEDLMTRISSDPNVVTPTELARFDKRKGQETAMRVGDEFLVRMPGPWDGPVRVVEVTPNSFRFVTLRGHLEAGQIEFRIKNENEALLAEIESWARAGDRLSHLMFDTLRMAKEIQLHMWTSMLERIAELSGGRRSSISIETRWIEVHD